MILMLHKMSQKFCLFYNNKYTSLKLKVSKANALEEPVQVMIITDRIWNNGKKDKILARWNYRYRLPTFICTTQVKVWNVASISVILWINSYLSIYLSIYPHSYTSVYQYICLSIPVRSYLSIYLSKVLISIYLSM